MCRNQRTTVDKILQSHRPVSIQSKKGEINLGDDRTVLDVKEGCGTVGQGWWNSSHLHGQRATPKRTSFGNKAREIWRKDGIRLDIQRRLLVLMNMFSLTRGQSLAAHIGYRANHTFSRSVSRTNCNCCWTNKYSRLGHKQKCKKQNKQKF